MVLEDSLTGKVFVLQFAMTTTITNQQEVSNEGGNEPKNPTLIVPQPSESGKIIEELFGESDEGLSSDEEAKTANEKTESITQHPDFEKLFGTDDESENEGENSKIKSSEQEIERKKLFEELGLADEEEPTQKTLETLTQKEDTQSQAQAVAEDKPKEKDKEREGPKITYVTEAPIPQIPKNSKVYFAKIRPNILGIQPKVFDPKTYDGTDIQPETYVDEGGIERIRYKTDSVIRWRWGPKATPDDIKSHQPPSLDKIETNARFVRWSDGSMHLFVGTDVYQVKEQPIVDHRHLFVKQSGFLQMQKKLTSKLVFIPVITEHSSQRHRALAVASVETAKRRKSKLFEKLIDPEKDKIEKEAKEEKKIELKWKIKTELQRQTSQSETTEELNPELLEMDSDDEGNIGAIKASFKERRFESEEVEKEKEKQILRAKKGAKLRKRREQKEKEEMADFIVDDDEVTDESGDLSDNEEEFPKRKKQKRK